MRLHARTTIAVGIAIASLVASAASAAPGGRTSGTATQECGEGIVMHSPTSLWPPNHKMKTIVISYAEPDETTHDGDTTRIMVKTIFHDQADEDGSNEMNGSGRPNAGLDWDGMGHTGESIDDEGPATTTVQIRAERSGRAREGRTYTIVVTCSSEGGSDGNAAADTVTLTVHVPHNMGA